MLGFFCLFFLVAVFFFFFFFFFYIASIPLRRRAVQKHAIFFFSYWLGAAIYLVNVFACPFLDSTKCSHYYWHRDNFKTRYFFNVCFQIFLFVYFIVIFDWHYCMLALIHQLVGNFYQSSANICELSLFIFLSVLITKSEILVVSLPSLIGSG